MINFLWKKIWRNKWLMFCLLMGNILLIGITIGTPLYITATMQRVFQQDLRLHQHTWNTFPAVASIRYNFNVVQSGPYQLSTYYNTRDNVWPGILRELDIPTERRITAYSFAAWPFTPVVPRENNPTYRGINMLGVTGFEDYIQITHGRLPADELVDGNIIEALAMVGTISYRDLLLGELMQVGSRDGQTPLYMRVVGIYELPPHAGAFWSVVPITFNNTILISDVLAYERFVKNYTPQYRITAIWTDILDITGISILRSEHYQEVIRSTRETYSQSEVWFFHENFYHSMDWQDARTDRLASTLWILLVPIFVMLALFVYMVSRQILHLDKDAISILESRGVSRAQILWLYVLQGVFVAAISYPTGFLLGLGICHFIGASNGFLDLVQRENLQVFITGEALLFGAASAFFSFLAMFLPVIRFSKIGIVEHKTSKNKRSTKPFWQRNFIDVILVGLAVLSLYNFNNQQDLQRAAMAADSRGLDPILFLTSSLFILGTALLCLRLFPYLVKLIFGVGKGLWPPSVYASMLRVMRTAGEEQFIMLFLIFTVSIGIFSAQSARTINLNNDHLIQYMGGADLMFEELWFNNLQAGEGAATAYDVGVAAEQPRTLMYSEPDFERFTGFDEVDAMTRVMMRNARFLGGTGGRFNAPSLQVMAVETDTFGETIWFRDDLLQIHINYFLNALASHANGVLLSDNFRTAHGFSIGDMIRLAEITPDGIPSGGSVDFTIVGFVEHWPGFAPVTRTIIPGTGDMAEHPAFIAIVNLGYLQLRWGMRPYQVWMNTNTPNNHFFYEFIDNYSGAMPLVFTQFHDTSASLIAARSDPIIQGTNGVLTISFLKILIICFTGFLIYWILSIRSRILQFGIFRAMGMSMRSILGLLFNEQILITLTALVIGVVIGEVSSSLFVPLVQISYTAANQVIPILIVMEANDYASIYIVLGTMVALCMVILGGYISKIKIDQALKLGED